MTLDTDELLKEANELYAEAKLGPDVHFMAPEIRPQIVSAQVKAVLVVLVRAINRELLNPIVVHTEDSDG